MSDVESLKNSESEQEEQKYERGKITSSDSEYSSSDSTSSQDSLEVQRKDILRELYQIQEESTIRNNQNNKSSKEQDDEYQ